MRFAPTSLVLAAVLLAPADAGAEDSPALPTVRTHRGVRVLTIDVRPAIGTHVAADLPLRAMVVGGATAVLERNGVVPSEEGAAARLQLPILPEEAPDGWRLTLDGGVCSDEGDLCLPFHVVADVPRRGPPRAEWTTVPGRGPADVFESPPSVELEVPVESPQGRGLPWFTASQPGDVEAAFADARTHDRAVLADFFAVWCPPCDLLRDEFLNAPARRELLSRFTLLKLDADAPASFSVKDRFRVGGYPTVLLLTADGEVIDRIVGYPGGDAMAERLERHRTPESLDALRGRRGRAEGQARRAPGLALSKRLHAQGDADEAWSVLEEDLGAPDTWVDPDEVRWGASLAAELARPAAADLMVRRARLPGALSERVSAVRSAAKTLRVASGPAAADAYLDEHRSALLDEFRSRIGATVAWGADGSGADVRRLVVGGPAAQWDLVDAAYFLGTWPGIDEATSRDLMAVGASAATLGILQAEGRSAAGPPSASVSISLRPTIGAVTSEQMDILRRREGRYHDLVSLLVAAGLHDTAEDYLRRLVATFPGTFTWHYRYAGFLRDHRSPAEALPEAEAALKHAYGDHALRAARRAAEILEALERPTDAREVVDAALRSPAPPQEDVRTHRYRQALEAIADRLPPTAEK